MSEQTAKRRFLTWKTARRVAIGLVILGAICFTAVMLWVVFHYELIADHC